MTKQKPRQTVYADELAQLRNYLQSEDNEDAKRDMLFPLFKKLFKE